MQLQFSINGLPQVAQQFWQAAAGAKVFCFYGSMGAGKTTTIAALCQGKGVRGAVSSPTYSIINEYHYTEHGVLKKLYHIDLYRLKDEEEIIQSGVEDCVYSGALCFVEWASKARYLFDEAAMHVVIETVDATTRRMTILNSTQFDAYSMVEHL